MKLFIEESTLTDIGDAVRDKGGTTELIPVPSLADAIRNLPTGGSGGVEVEPIVLTGNQDSGCMGPITGAYIDLFGNTISTEKIKGVSSMFKNNTAKRIPFAINCEHSSYQSMLNMFSFCPYLQEMPAIYNAYPSSFGYLFQDCPHLRTLHEDCYSTWDFSRMHSYNRASMAGMFTGCFSLRKIPNALLKELNGVQRYSDSIYYSSFYRCSSLDEVIGLPVIQEAYTSNAFYQLFYACYRLKDFTFQTNEDGTPITANWSNQTITMTDAGWYPSFHPDVITTQNSGITKDDEVITAEDYAAKKNTENWYTSQHGFCRYNHDSAVRTINSLPDCSGGSSNVITFDGAVGALTDGGAINTLTEAEIAVAAAKGWTVTLV